MIDRHFGNKQPTKQALRTALGSLLVMRRNLDTVNAAGLARSYGVSEPEVRLLIAAEIERRAGAAT